MVKIRLHKQADQRFNEQCIQNSHVWNHLCKIVLHRTPYHLHNPIGLCKWYNALWEKLQWNDKPLVPCPLPTRLLFIWCDILLTGSHHSTEVNISVHFTSNSSILLLLFLTGNHHYVPWRTISCMIALIIYIPGMSSSVGYTWISTSVSLKLSYICSVFEICIWSTFRNLFTWSTWKF